MFVDTYSILSLFEGFFYRVRYISEYRRYDIIRKRKKKGASAQLKEGLYQLQNHQQFYINVL